MRPFFLSFPGDGNLSSVEVKSVSFLTLLSLNRHGNNGFSDGNNAEPLLTVLQCAAVPCNTP